jgi:hypothetical protein
MAASPIFSEIPNFYRIIPLKQLRKTPGVSFDNVPMEFLPHIDAIDRVIHAQERGFSRPGGRRGPALVHAPFPGRQPDRAFGRDP